MICIKRCVYIIWIISGKKFICFNHSFRKITCRLHSFKYICYDSVTSGEFKVKEAVNSACIVSSVLTFRRPGFSHYIGIRFYFFNCLIKPGKYFGVFGNASRYIISNSVKPESVYTDVQPEFENILKFISYSLIFEVEIRHFRAESGFIVPVGAFDWGIAILLFFCKIIIINIRTGIKIRFFILLKPLEVFNGF